MTTDEAISSGGLLNSREAAQYLTTTPRHLRRLRANHGLASIRLGSKVRFAKADLDAFIAQSRSTDQHHAV